MPNRPLWAEISLPNLIHNFHLLRKAAGEAELIAVVKANAYGHGALICAPVLTAAGARWLGVTSVEEGVAVRAVCEEARILVMGGIWDGEAGTAIEHRLTPVVWELMHLKWLEEAAVQRGLPRGSVPVHLEIDTGMARQGVPPVNLVALLKRFCAATTLSIEGVMTHFHSPEILDGPSTAVQLERLRSALDVIAGTGIRPGVIHAGNSATLLAGEGARNIVELAAKYGASAMLRPGLALYGYAPRFTGTGAVAAVEKLNPVLAWKTRVISLRTIAAGESAGYCATFHAARTSRLALLPVGYADGLNRLLSNRGEVLVRGRRVPVAGRVSMDLTIVDVTDLETVELGDEVVLIGEQNAERIAAYELADLASTIPYEVLCNISARVPRVVIDSSEGHA